MLVRLREILFGRRRGSSATISPSRAPDLDPADVPPGKCIGFDGRETKPSRGSLTGLEGGRSGVAEPPGYGSIGADSPGR